jgi:hypothetical protein
MLPHDPGKFPVHADIALVERGYILKAGDLPAIKGSS